MQGGGAPVIDVHLAHEVAPIQDRAVLKRQGRPAIPDQSQAHDVPALTDRADVVPPLEPPLESIEPARHSPVMRAGFGR